jgi:ParB-like chromosome segregation protein Spo0J
MPTMAELEEVTRRETIALDDLPARFHPRNPKTHNVPELVTSLQRFGFAAPVVICERTGLVAAGHGRIKALLAMRSQGMERPRFIEGDGDEPWMIPVARGWASDDDDELLAYVIADNRQNELGGWDDAILAEIGTRLATLSRGLVGTGYDAESLAAIVARMKGPPPTVGDPDDVPEPPADPVTQMGDLWILGGHTVCPNCNHENPVGGR